MGLGHEIQYFARWQAEPGLRARADSDEFWRALCPDLRITDLPFEGVEPPFSYEADTVAGAVASMRRDGYLTTGPALGREACAALARAVLRITEAGYHPLFLAVYDEFWRPLAQLGNLLAPILTAPPRLLGDFWIWCVSARHAPAGWSMHRDKPVTEPTVSADGVPSLLTVWLPYTDATPENGCIRLLPASRDPALGATGAGDDARLEVLPAPAGSVLAWNQRVLHGSAPCAPDTPPRISAGVYFQSAARPSYGDPVPFDAPLPFARRLHLIAAALLRYQKQFRFPREALRFVGAHALPDLPRRRPVA
jgi:hypothetical protein